MMKHISPVAADGRRRALRLRIADCGLRIGDLPALPAPSGAALRAAFGRPCRSAPFFRRRLRGIEICGLWVMLLVIMFLGTGVRAEEKWRGDAVIGRLEIAAGFKAGTGVVGTRQGRAEEDAIAAAKEGTVLMKRLPGEITSE